MGHKGKWAGEIITTFQAYQMAQETPDWWRKPVGREGQPLIMRLRKKDMLELDVNGERKIVTIFKQSTSEIDMAIHYEANASARISAKKLERIQKSPRSLQKAGAVLLSVSPSGKVRRHKA